MKLKITKAKAKRAAVVALFVLAVILMVYTAGVHFVAGSIIEVEGSLMWKTAPRGTLFPIPNVPGGLMQTISVLETDAFIYTYLVRTGVLIAVTLMLWVAVGWVVWKKRRRKSKVKGRR